MLLSWPSTLQLLSIRRGGQRILTKRFAKIHPLLATRMEGSDTSKMAVVIGLVEVHCWFVRTRREPAYSVRR